jgi:hypothetical protein
VELISRLRPQGESASTGQAVECLNGTASLR